MAGLQERELTAGDGDLEDVVFFANGKTMGKPMGKPMGKGWFDGI